jgi:asparagine synthase (glutamine-hydrolysing)
MSAIASIYHLNGEPINLDHGRRMMKELEKFPADDVQTWNSDKVFLGCHAQWITPESIGEKLPYYDQERKLAITADAIIDNREDLFEKLQIKKSKQKTITDSELILLSYDKWGEDTPKYLVGDFAFIIWDAKEQKLFGARDFSGSRTLYYYIDQHRVVFCTAIRPLLALPFVEKNLNEQWLAEFLAIPGVTDALDPESTVYKNIKQLPPSHSISVVSGRVKFSRYFKFFPTNKMVFKSNDEYEEAFKEVFQKAVSSQIRSCSSVGSRLSGGLDSGAVTSFAAKALSKENKQLHTFSYIPVNDFIDWTPKSRLPDERPFINSTVKYVGNISDNYLDFEGKSAYTEINDLLDIMEMPYKFIENSFWLKGIIEEAHVRGIRVLLNGSRGNYTISWGPALDFYSILLKQMNFIRLYKEINLFSNNRKIGRKEVVSKIGKITFPFIEGTKESYEFPMLINPEFAKKTDVLNKLKSSGLDGSFRLSVYEARKRQFERSNSWNLNGTSRAKLSLPYSVWDRDPTNDLRVIQFCLSIPEEQYVQNGLDRALIRRVTKNYLPDNVRLNYSVRGLQAADGVHRMKPHWNKFIEEIKMIILDKDLKGILNVPIIENAILNLQDEARPEFAYHADFKILMRSLIVSRFIKKFI